MNQREMVINYIKAYGSISPFQAFLDLGITKLATVCSDLRLKCGVTIYSCYEETRNRWGKIVAFKRYYLDKNLMLKDQLEKECKII